MTKREKAFVLSLIATVIFPPLLWLFIIANRFEWRLMWGGLGFPWKLIPVVTFSLIGLITLIMIIGLLFTGISKTKIGRIIGGIIILTMGMIIGILMFLMMKEERVWLEGFLLAPAVMAMVGGCLGIGGASEDEEVKKKQYSKASIFITSIMSFVSAIFSVFVFFLSVKAHELGALFFIYFVSPPLLIISIILNTISTVIVKRKESIPQKRTKILAIMLITVTWCIITLLVVSLFLEFGKYLQT